MRIVRNVALLVGTLLATLIVFAIVDGVLEGYPRWVAGVVKGALVVGLWVAVSRAERRMTSDEDDGS